MEYIDALDDSDGGDAAGEHCFLCRYWQRSAADESQFVIWRTDVSLVLLNRFPYTSGHVLVTPAAHKAELEELTEGELLDLSLCLRDAKRMLAAALGPQGFNLGMNLGRCAGAGLPGHLHWHIVPRWAGDTNFMPVIGDTRVLPHALQRVFDKCRQVLGPIGRAPA